MALGRTLLSKLLIMLLFCVATPAMAGTPLDFKLPSPSITQSIKAYIFVTEPFFVAEPDLNEDGINELIAKHTCKNKTCVFSIFAREKDGRLLSLGEITARALQLSNTYNGSTRNIEAFQDALNEYSSTEYEWNFTTTKYQLKKEEAKK